MMKIAVCDDNSVELKIITDLLDKYILSSENKFEYDTFYDYSQLNGKASDYDLFILDYMMPGKNGMDFARELYDQFKSTKNIIFTTAYSEIVYDSFEVNTFRFLVKPIEENKLFKALDDFFNKMSEEKLVIKVSGKNFVLDLNNVSYFESQGRRIIAHILNGNSVCFYSKTSELDKALPTAKFFRVHRSYSVRLDKVKSFTYDEVILENGEKVSMSTKKYYDFCDAYLKNIKRSYL